MDKEKGRQINELFGSLRKKFPLNKQDAYEEAQLAIAQVIQALAKEGISEDQVIKAIGNAKTPNAVSRGLRARISIRT